MQIEAHHAQEVQAAGTYAAAAVQLVHHDAVRGRAAQARDQAHAHVIEAARAGCAPLAEGGARLQQTHRPTTPFVVSEVSSFGCYGYTRFEIRHSTQHLSLIHI